MFTSVIDEITRLASDIGLRLRQFFSTDPSASMLIDTLTELIPVSLREAYFISCVGLPTEIPLLDIYQVSRIYSMADAQCSIDSFLDADRNRLILAWPGVGKTTLLSYTFIQVAKSRVLLPLLFFVRIEGSLAALINLVLQLQKHKRAGQIPDCALLLLIDGFDEISVADRVLLGKALNDFRALSYGYFYVSCRLYYDTGQVVASSWVVRAFEQEDAVRFAACFFNNAVRENYTAQNIDAAEFIQALVDRGLFELVRVPLLLSMSCVVKCESDRSMPTDAVELLEGAIDLLNERWDRLRRIKGREKPAGIGPWKRIRFLKKVAFEMPGREVPEAFLFAMAEHFFKDEPVRDFNPTSLIEEIIQLSGLMRRTSGRNYQFMHAAIQDFLAAKYSVESGIFFPVSVKVWDARAGYAACLSGDATQSLLCALRHGVDNIAFNDCLNNGARFDIATVARETVRALERPVRVVTSSRAGASPHSAEVKISHDFFHNARPRFIGAMMTAVLLEKRRGTHVDVVVGYCLSELKLRNSKLDAQTAIDLAAVYRTLEFSFMVHKGAKVLNVMPKELCED